MAKNIKLSEIKSCYLTKFSLALNKCSEVNKFQYFKCHTLVNNQSNFCPAILFTACTVLEICSSFLSLALFMRNLTFH